MSPRVVRALFRGLGALPFPVMEALGAAIGLLHWCLPNRTRSNARANLARCQPERGEASRRRLLRANMVATGRTLAESAWFLGRGQDEVVGLVRSAHGLEHLEQARDAGNGIIFATPHLGAWELATAYVSLHVPLTVMYRPPRVAELDDLLRAGRERLGARAVPTDGSGVRALHRALRAGESIGVLPDQQPREGQGVEAPFMGHPAPTMTLLSRIAARTGATVLFLAMVRRPRARGFDFHVWPADPAVADADPATAAAAVNAEVERAIAIAPAQYMWNYQRFRRRRQGGGKRE